MNVFPSGEELEKLVLDTDLTTCNNKEQLYRCQIENNEKIIASEDIEERSVVYQGTPFFTFQNNAESKTGGLLATFTISPEEVLDFFQEKMERLFPRDQASIINYVAQYENANEDTPEILELVAQQIQHVLVAKTYSNIFALNEFQAALYITASKFNHSCYPNCFCSVSGKTLTIKTFRPVQKGEELTHSYFPDCVEIENQEERQKLINTFSGRGFTCQCELCLGQVTRPKNFAKAYFMIQSLPSCANCGRTRHLVQCSKCKKTNYCGKECQTRHWKLGHKKVCSSLF